MNLLRIILALCCYAATGAAQIPVLDSSWQLTESNETRQVFTSARGRWAIVFGSTNYFPTPIAPPGPFNLWPTVITNIYAHTNGRIAELYSTNTWTGRTSAPVTIRATNNLIYGAVGFTAFTVHNSFTSNDTDSRNTFGQIQGTAVTPRHVIVRGHGFGATGNVVASYWSNNANYVYFVASNNASVVRQVHATLGVDVECCAGQGDYTVIQLTADLPASIEPLQVIYDTNYLAYFPYTNSAFLPFYACQHNLSTALTGLLGFNHNNWVGGDSGAANYVLLPHAERRFALALFSIRSGSMINGNIQAAINTLCTFGGLSPSSYVMQPIDLNSYAP